MLGIPYAPHDLNDPAVVICPVCSERIRLTRRKDSESLAGDEYQRHYKEQHSDTR